MFLLIIFYAAGFLGLDPDDFLGATVSSADGRFRMARSDEAELGSLEPYLKIRHRCSNGNPIGLVSINC